MLAPRTVVAQQKWPLAPKVAAGTKSGAASNFDGRRNEMAAPLNRGCPAATSSPTAPILNPPRRPHPTRERSPLTGDQENLVTVAERSSEPEAAILVSVLQDEGIRAVATGGFTAGFRAEAPGWVAVKTFERDAARARQIITELMASRVDEDPSE